MKTGCSTGATGVSPVGVRATLPGATDVSPVGVWATLPGATGVSPVGDGASLPGATGVSPVGVSGCVRRSAYSFAYHLLLYFCVGFEISSTTRPSKRTVPVAWIRRRSTSGLQPAGCAFGTRNSAEWCIQSNVPSKPTTG